jgi:uncharacterized protein (DUF1697 family)
MECMMEVTNYTSEELLKIAGGVMVSGMAVAMVDAGIVSTAIEATAMAKEIAGSAKKYPNNAIIQALFSEEAIKKAKADNPAPLSIKAEEMKPETAITTATAKINEALAILNQKATPEDVQQYKEFIYACADRVANAAGSGLFGSGVKVSEKEAAALESLKGVLGL